jgi:preprotein translocase subunit SecD
MTIRGQHGKHHLYLHAALVFTIFAVVFTTALTVAGGSGDQPRKIKFELRLASYQKVEGWEISFVPGPPKTPVWISPEVALTNSDIARAWPQPDSSGFVVGIMLTEEGALKLAQLTKSHIGENVAIMVDGQVMSAPKIMAEITGGRALIHGIFTEAEAGALAKRIMVQ